MNDAENIIRKLLKERGTLRIRDCKEAGIHPENIRRLLRKGVLQRFGRGLYASADLELTQFHTLAEVARKVPRSIACLISALQYHNIGTQAPHQVWIALPRGTKAPRIDYPPIKTVHFSGDTYSEGTMTVEIEKTIVTLTTPAKTIADCFKFRNKIGMDIVLEALKEGWRQKMFTVDELMSYAGICRVENIMKPYLEIIV